MKQFGTLLTSGIIALCFSLSVAAQSSEKSLDQTELMKQFTGTWMAELEEGGTLIWEIIPLGKGYEQNLFWKSDGETYRTDKGIIGFPGNGGVEMIFLWSRDGEVSRDYGEFESEKRIIFKRFNIEHTRVYSIFDYNFITSDKIKMIWKSRGDEESWDNAEVSEWIWTKVKK